MAKSSPSEKRQEERLIQELRDFQRSSPANKRCFDCNEMMPQYVCLDFNTFVCTACSGIHREFAHRVKSISMSKFTESEVKNMISHGGNEAAQKYWRSKHDPSFRPNGGSDGERTRNFIRLTYIDRKWVYESPRHAKDEEPQRTTSKSSKKKDKTTDSDDDFFSSSSKSGKADSGFADFSNFEGSSRTAAAAAQSFGDFSSFDSPAPAKKADDGFADFGDFGGSSSTASAAQKATPKATPPPPPPVPKFGSFKIAPPPGSNFSSASVSTPPATNDLMGPSPPKKSDDPFGFDAPAPQAPTQPAPVASSPFDAFDAPTPTSRAGSRSNSASLDPFSNMNAATPPAPAQATKNTSPFDAFGSSPAASPSAFDAFAAPSPASTAGSNAFDAFGGDAFTDFARSNNSSRTNSVALDPFASKPEKPAPTAAAADPFAAFDGMQSSSGAGPSPSNSAPTPDFGAAAPEFLAGILLAFVQLRLRSHFSLASWLVNGLTFFLPPEDELIATLNGQPLAKGNKAAKVPAGQPLSASEKMDKFYVRVAKTEPGVFSQTLFFELYEMLVVLVSSASIGCWVGSVVSFTAPWFSPAGDAADEKVDLATYGLVSAMLVALWFPLQLNFAQGWAGYEARLGLAVGFVGLIASGFIILSPKGMLDFDLELAAQMAGERVQMVLRAVGFTDADFVNIAPLAEMAKATLFFTFALFAGIFTCTTFLPLFRFARMYSEMIKDKQTSTVMKILLHFNMLFPVLICALWVPRLSSAVLVPSDLVKCSPRALTRDCLQSEVLGLTNTTSSDIWKWYSLTESQFHTLRIYVVFVACLVRLLCFRTHLQYFLLEPREVMASLVGRPGFVDGVLLQSKVRLQFNYVPIIALQYLAPVCALLASAQLLMKQTATPLGIFKGVAWVMQRVVPSVSIPASLMPEGLNAASLNVLPDPTVAPNLGGFRLGDDLNKENVTPFLRGMSQFPVLTAEFYEAALGFLIWFLSFTMFAVSLAGLLYWRNVAAHGSTDIEQTPVRQNKQTPKTLKNQLKSLKMKKNK